MSLKVGELGYYDDEIVEIARVHDDELDVEDQFGGRFTIEPEEFTHVSEV